jgi:hypothetical protein
MRLVRSSPLAPASRRRPYLRRASNISGCEVSGHAIILGSGRKSANERRLLMAMAGLYVGTSSSLPRANPGCNQQISVHTAVALFPAGGTAIHPAIPWWLWWNILSADAPMVAVLWAALLSHASGSRLHVVDGTILFLAVWLIYIGDRLLDGWTAKNRAVLRERHRYCEGHRTILAGLLGVACIAIFLLTFGYLPSGEINAGVKLGALLIAYMMSIHIGRARLASLLPKELVVGSLFAAGVTLPFWSRFTQFRSETFVPWLLFALLCSLNCLSIECWETGRFWDSSRTGHPPLVRWASSRLGPIAATLSIAALLAYGVALVTEGVSRPELMAVCLGALLILFLNYASDRLSPAALRVLADAALAVPALMALAIQS